MPDNMLAGNYTVRVEGTEEELGESYIFKNETEIVFNPKAVSVFVQTDNAMIKKKGLSTYMR